MPLWNSFRLTVSSCSMLKTHGRWLMRLFGLALCRLKSFVGLFREHPEQATSDTFWDVGVKAEVDVSMVLIQCWTVTWCLELMKSLPKMGEFESSSQVAHQYENTLGF